MTFIGRQPICKGGAEVVAYELLSRGSALSQPSFHEADPAVARALVDSFVDMALDKVAGRTRAFVPVTSEFLLSPFSESLPKDRVVLEVSGDTADDSHLVESIRRLAGRGYWIALEGIVDAERARPLAEFAKFAKLDIRAESWDVLVTQFLGLKKLGIPLIARNVETRSDYEFSTRLGFDLCQGYFFCKPNASNPGRIPFNRLSTLHLLSKLQDPDISPQELEHAVGQDLAMTYRLLRYLNSPAHAFPRKIESIRHAVSLVGTRLLSHWASLALLGSIENKPRELMNTAMVRAHMCQQLGSAMYERSVSEFFTVGLLSVVDALVDRPLRDALALLPMADPIRDALLCHKGTMGSALNCVKAYEHGDWDNARFGTLNERTIRDIYLRSLAMTHGFTQTFAA